MFCFPVVSVFCFYKSFFTSFVWKWNIFMLQIFCGSTSFSSFSAGCVIVLLLFQVSFGFLVRDLLFALSAYPAAICCAFPFFISVFFFFFACNGSWAPLYIHVKMGFGLVVAQKFSFISFLMLSVSVLKYFTIFYMALASNVWVLVCVLAAQHKQIYSFRKLCILISAHVSLFVFRLVLCSFSVGGLWVLE